MSRLRAALRTLTTALVRDVVSGVRWVRRRRVDVVIAIGIALVGACTALITVSAEGQGEYFQDQYEPAVRLACGDGFEDYAEPDPALERFLLERRGTYDCAEPGTETYEINHDQAAGRYLYTSVAILWRVLGVRWSSVVPLFGMLAAAYGASLYACRGSCSAEPSPRPRQWRCCSRPCIGR